MESNPTDHNCLVWIWSYYPYIQVIAWNLSKSIAQEQQQQTQIAEMWCDSGLWRHTFIRIPTNKYVCVILKLHSCTYELTRTCLDQFMYYLPPPTTKKTEAHIVTSRMDCASAASFILLKLSRFLWTECTIEFANKICTRTGRRAGLGRLIYESLTHRHISYTE